MPTIGTGLTEACDAGNISVAKIMLENGAKNKQNVLFHACANDRVDVVEFLIDSSAECKSRDIMAAVKQSAFKVIKFLGSHSCCGWNRILPLACRLGYVDIVKIAVDSGATNLAQGYCLALHANQDRVIDLMKYYIHSLSMTLRSGGGDPLGIKDHQAAIIFY